MNASRYFLLLLCTCWLSSLQGQDTIWSRVSFPEVPPVCGVSFTADGSQILHTSTCPGSRLLLWNTLTGLVEWDFRPDSALGCVEGALFSKQGRYFVYYTNSGHLRLFDHNEGNPFPQTIIEVAPARPRSIAFAPGNQKLAVGCSNGKLLLYGAEDGILLKDIQTDKKESNAVHSLAWSANGKFIATGGSNGLVQVWDSSGSLVKTLTGHQGTINALVFSPDSKMLFSGSDDQQIRLWDVPTGTYMRSFEGHFGPVSALALSADGAFLVSGGGDDNTRIWEVESGRPLASMKLPTAGNIQSVDWAPNAYKVAVGTQSGKLSLWDVKALCSGVPASNFKPIVSTYPSPATRWLFLDIQAANGLKERNRTQLRGQPVRIFDPSGNTMYSGKLEGSTSRMDIGSLPPGPYILEFSVGGTVISERFEKKGF